MNRNINRNGFSLVEILVVVVIISLLAGLITPQIIDKFNQAKYDIAKTQVTVVENAIVDFERNCNRSPKELDELLNRPSDIKEEDWKGPYLKPSQKVDPWDTPFQYRVTPNGVEIISFGKDKREGGDGYNRDISSKD
ncbi:MAG: type II secretion system major pseudopilin GspG [Sedimentisphaerales bacterium]|nr:type II secretion system major pseudopilin GspG [Sedimentisphaerales bacterium]